MTETQTIPSQSTPSSFKMLRAMVGIGILCALLIVLTFEGTFNRIEKNKAEALEKAIFKVIPGISKTKAFFIDQAKTIAPAGESDQEGQLIYAGYTENDEFVGVAIEAAGQGYADIIRILYGYNPTKQEIVGFYVLGSKETPGLGDKIEKDLNFLSNFEALDVSLTDDKSQLNNKVIYVKSGEKKHQWEVDGITGATISSKAIGDMLGISTEQLIPLIYQNKELFELKEITQ